MKTEALIKSTIAIVSALFRFQGNCSLSGEMAVLNYKSLEEMEHLLNTVSLGRERERETRGGNVLFSGNYSKTVFTYDRGVLFDTLDIYFLGKINSFLFRNNSNLIKIAKL